MRKHKYKVFITSFAIISLTRCTNAPQKITDSEVPRTSYAEEQEGRSITTAAAKEISAHNFVEINFPQSSSELSKSAISSLESAVLQARQQGVVNKIIVLSWSDNEYPSKKLNKLSKSQRTLAENRNKAVRKYFNQTTNVNIDTYNMAERPSTLAKWFNTTDTKLKNSLTAAGLPTTGDELQYPSKASHSVVLIKVE